MRFGRKKLSAFSGQLSAKTPIGWLQKTLSHYREKCRIRSLNKKGEPQSSPLILLHLAKDLKENSSAQRQLPKGPCPFGW
jgi:hypothetical protein